jgi:UDP-3-O-[3-hydroxymyristoyl] glucosamine N-acyltransferase
MQRIRTSLVSALAFAVVALVAFARPPAPTPGPAPTPPIEVPPGVDLLQATGTFHLSLPSGFFGSGSNAYSGDLAASGAALKTAGPWELGTTNVVIRHLSNLSLTWPSSGVGHDVVKVEELQLNGNSAITVTFMAAAPQTWTVSVALSGDRPARGSYDLTRTSTSGGTFTASLPIHPVFTFKRSSTTKVFDAGDVTLTTSSGSWGEVSSSSTAGLVVPQFPLGVALTATSLTSSALDLSIAPAAVNSGRPGASYIDPTATVDAGVATIGRQCSIGDHATIAAGVVIGPHATIGSYAQVGTNAVIGDYASIGSNVTIAAGAVVGSSAVISSGATISTDAIVLSSASIGSSCSIGAGAVVGNTSVLQSGCSVGAGANLGDGVQMGASSSVAAALTIAPNAVIASSASVTDPIVLVAYADGTTALVSLPSTGLAAGGQECAIIGDVGKDMAVVAEPGSGEIKTAGFPRYPDPDPDDYGLLELRVGLEIAPVAGYGTGQDYVKGTRECGYFAEALRQHLATWYPETTFTCVWKLRPWYHWYMWPWVSRWFPGHVLTDIHWDDGRITWIEAQFAGDAGVDGGTEGWLDGDLDGFVTYSDGHDADEPTDGDLDVVVYTSRAQAEADGVDVVGD